MQKALATILLTAAVSATTGDIADVLLIGDSFFGYAGQSGADNKIQKYCSGKKFKNRAISGSTAAQWALTNAATGTPCGNDKCCLDDIDATGFCSIDSAFTTEAATGYTKVWVSLGGNDYMQGGAGCESSSLPTLKTNLATIFGYLTAHSAAATHTNYLMTGYMSPKAAPQETCTADKMPALQTAIGEACTADARCTFIDIGLLAKATATSFSSNSWNFVDPIHLNDAGFCTVMSQATIQTYFGCTAPAKPYDCYTDLLWLWILIGVVSAVGVGVLIWGILSLTGTLDSEEEIAAREAKELEEKKTEEQKEKDRAVDSMSADFSDFHATGGEINNRHSFITQDFNAPMKYAVEVIQYIGMLPYQNYVQPEAGAGHWLL